MLADRVPTLLPFRRRLMAVPFGLDHPRWVDDPDFDLDNHLHRVALPAPGGEAELRAMVAEVMGRPLDPQQPPWEMHVVEGLAGGRVGLIAKVHHSVIDGVAGVQLMAQLLDFSAEGRPAEASARPGARRPCRRARSWWPTPSPVCSPAPFRALGPCAKSGGPRSAWPARPR